MYFKINKTGVSEYEGLVQVRYDLYLDKGDYKYNEHHVTVPIIPAGGYPGAVDAQGNPVDINDYNKWLKSLPTEERGNPFCCHFCQFEPTVTDEELLYVGQLALDMSYCNWKDGNLHKNKNQPIVFSADPQKKAACVARVDQIKASTVLPTTVTKKVK